MIDEIYSHDFPFVINLRKKWGNIPPQLIMKQFNIISYDLMNPNNFFFNIDSSDNWINYQFTETYQQVIEKS